MTTKLQKGLLAGIALPRTEKRIMGRVKYRPSSERSIKKFLFLLSLLLANAYWANAQSIVRDGLYYKLDNTTKTAAITGLYSNIYRLIIPSTVSYEGNEYSVTTIGERAFSSCSHLTEVTIPNSVTSIGNQAFGGCSSLTKVTIGNSVTAIGDYTFAWCSSLAEVTIPNSVTAIGKRAFLGCNNLREVTIPNSVTTIGDEAFVSCGSLTEVTIPNSVTTIGYRAFQYCSNLTEVNIPNSVTAIGDDAFYGCSSLTEVNIPNSVTTIGGGAFCGCSSLTKVHIFDLSAWCRISFEGVFSNPLYYANHFYLNGEEITNLTIPDDVTSIGDDAFWGCRSLTEVTIPNSVTTIGNWAFWGCRSLTEVTIPNSVTAIGDGVFSNCSSLMEVTIPNSVTTIGDEAFAWCDNLTEVTIGSNVKSIGYSAFSDCPFLTSVTSLNPTPPAINSYTFTSKTEQNAILYVPEGCKDVYETRLNWRNFLNIQSIISADINTTLTGRPGENNVIYTIDGVRCNETSISNLPGGIYIVDGKKRMVK